MLKRPVTSISARKRGTTRFLTGSTPRTCSASSSSRILRAPRSAVIAVPATPASTIAVTFGADLADRGEHEDPAEAIQRAEQREEVRGLQAGRGVADADRGDQQREPAEAQREEELGDELAAVGVGRAQGGHDRPARQDHHVPDFLDEVPRWEERPLCGAANHFVPLLGWRPDCAFTELYAMRWRRATASPTQTHWYRGLAVRGSRCVHQRSLLGACAAAPGRWRAAAVRPRSRTPANRQGTSRCGSRTRASRPSQSVARPARLVLSVRNTGAHAVPNVTVAVNSFDYISDYPNLAARRRPVWVIDEGPGPLPRPAGRNGRGRPAGRRPDGERQRVGARTRWRRARRAASCGT